MNLKWQQRHGITRASLFIGVAAIMAAVASADPAPQPASDSSTVTIQAGADWIPLPYDPWIEPGSALDFSSVLPHHAPAGKFGRVIVVDDHFEFEGLPGVSQRFYGVNLCNTANLPSSPEAADRFVANLARIGYNALRIHHHERDLIAENGGWLPEQDDTVPSPAQMEKLDWLVAACVAHGVYLTTDLYVSRSYATRWRAIGIDRDGRMAGPSFKILCAFWEPAYSNLCAWTHNFLCHVNPYTGRSLAEEPALVALALINEGNLGNWGASALRKTPGVADAWQAWLAERRNGDALRANDGAANAANDAALRANDGAANAANDAALRANDVAAGAANDGALRANDVIPSLRGKAAPVIAPKAPVIAAEGGSSLPRSGSVIALKAPVIVWDEIPDSIPDDLYAADGSTPERRHAAAFATFLAERETLLFERLKAFVREECGCRAPLSSLSAWYYPVQYQLPRTHFDYVDEHFYVDHPKWLGRDWHLPSKCPNVNPVAGRDAGARDIEWRRLMDKPFCLTEWNFSGPGRFRGVGGIVTGALGALQDWDGMWRFAWSHGRDGIEKPGARLDYFNVHGDPLGLAAERAALCLFLRRDLPALETERPLDLDEAALLDPRNGAPRLPGRGQSLALGWTRKVGTKVVSHAEFAKSAEEKASSVGSASSAGVSINPGTGTFLLDTPRTAGGFAESGTHRAGALSFEIAGRDGPALQDNSATNHSSLVTRHSSLRGGNPVAATVWASSLDGEPLSTSSRILVTHLTDVQNSGIRYGDAARTILLDWGGLPHLAENGSALIELQLAGGAGAEPPSLAIYRLDTAGRRLAEIPASFDPATARLRFIARTDYNPVAATLFYEIVRGPASPAP